MLFPQRIHKEIGPPVHWPACQRKTFTSQHRKETSRLASQLGSIRCIQPCLGVMSVTPQPDCSPAHATMQSFRTLWPALHFKRWLRPTNYGRVALNLLCSPAVSQLQLKLDTWECACVIRHKATKGGDDPWELEKLNHVENVGFTLVNSSPFFIEQVETALGYFHRSIRLWKSMSFYFWEQWSDILVDPMSSAFIIGMSAWAKRWYVRIAKPSWDTCAYRMSWWNWIGDFLQWSLRRAALDDVVFVCSWNMTRNRHCFSYVLLNCSFDTRALCFTLGTCTSLLLRFWIRYQNCTSAMEQIWWEIRTSPLPPKFDTPRFWCFLSGLCFSTSSVHLNMTLLFNVDCMRCNQNC